MPFLGLLAAATVTATVTVETAEGVRPVANAVMYAVRPVPRRQPRGAPLELRCGETSVEPPMAVVVRPRRLRIVNDRSELTHVAVQYEDGRTLLTATLISQGQKTPEIALSNGRVKVRCGTGKREVTGDVMALPHTHYTVSGDDGAVAFDPEVESEWEIWHPALGRVFLNTWTATLTFPHPTF